MLSFLYSPTLTSIHDYWKNQMLIIHLVKNLHAMQEISVQYSWASLVAHLQCRRPRFDLWLEKIPWRRERLPIPVFCPGEFHELYSPWGCKELDMTKLLSPSYLWHFSSTNICSFLSFCINIISFFFPNKKFPITNNNSRWNKTEKESSLSSAC